MSSPPDSPIPNPPLSASSLRAGQVVGGGRYVLKRILGQGGMGVVWLAYDKRLGEPAALKFLPAQIASDPIALDNLRRETLRSRKLSHPNIIRIHDLYEAANELPFISMEYVDGPDLHYLRARRPSQVLSWNFLGPLLRQLCGALAYAHDERVIHRDLKPANLILDSNGRLKLADFGLACVVHASLNRMSGYAGAGVGTLHYMSPQQADGEKPGVTDDIYALGATVYELLTSRPPFYEGDIGYQVRNTRPQAMAERLLDLELVNEVPSEVSALVMACLAKDPGQRPPSAKAILEWFESLPTSSNLPSQIKGQSAESKRNAPTPSPGASTPAQDMPTPPRRVATGRLILIASATLLISGLGAWLWVHKKDKNTDSVAAAVDAPRQAMVDATLTETGPSTTSSFVNTNSQPTNPVQSPDIQTAIEPSSFEVLFNGRDLSGWQGDPRIWSVQDGVVVAHATRGMAGLETNTHLFWRGIVTNFVLHLSYKLDTGNSGILYRCKKLGAWNAGGYQYEIWKGSTGGLLDDGEDRSRRDLARIKSALYRGTRKNEWNDVVIYALGNRLVHKLNGVTMVDVIDSDRERQLAYGLLALESYGETTVYFKDIRLQRRP